jgi:hypothetical protein
VIAALCFLALALQQPQPWKGTLAQGLQRVQELAQAGQKEEALALAEALASARRTSRARAAVEYARGVVHAGAGEREPAGESFEHARADGAGELRLASMYNLGTLALEQGEECYKKLPEVSGKPAAPPPPVPGAAPGAPAAPPGPDPLAEARKSYLAARARFVERLRAQWDDADTRANLELVQRRLKRLDEIEKQRKEEQQKQQQQSKDSKNDKDAKDKQDPKGKQDKQDPDKPKDDQKDKQDPQQQPPDPKDQQQDKQDPQKPEQQKPDEQPKPGEEPKPPESAPQPQLSKEELTRLLDKLQQLEEQAAKLRAQIHKARRVAVKKDW